MTKLNQQKEYYLYLFLILIHYSHDCQFFLVCRIVYYNYKNTAILILIPPLVGFYFTDKFSDKD